MQTLDAPITQSKYPIRVSYIPKQKAIQTKQSQTEKASPRHNKQRDESINQSFRLQATEAVAEDSTRRQKQAGNGFQTRLNNRSRRWL